MVSRKRDHGSYLYPTTLFLQAAYAACSFYARRLLAVFLIRIKASSYLFYRCPTVNNGSILLCTRVLFHIAANFHRRTANGRPYGSTILEHRIIVGASIARPLIAWGQFALRMPEKKIFKKAVDKPGGRC
ncbi:MAG: hypothetical protein ACI3VE_04755, partial [Oscillospiraceae bacterium]